MLAEEYRMYPRIAKMGSALFCNSQQIDILFVLLRDGIEHGANSAPALFPKYLI